MAVYALVPARQGSKGIPQKNIKPLCGQPLIYWCLRALNQVSALSEIHVATDGDKIEDVVNGFGLDKVRIFRRDPANATDTAATESVMLEFLNKKAFADDDLLILVQATTPYLRNSDVEKGLVLLGERGTDSLLSCARVHQFFWSEDGKPLNYDYRHRPRRQEFDGALVENGSFYINRVDNIRRDQNRLSGTIAVYPMPAYTMMELDEPHDWPLAESLMRRFILDSTTRPIKLLMMDVDGVLTDGGMYYTQAGDELKKFNTRDGMGLELLRKRGIKTAILTSENTKIVSRRAHKLNIDFLFQGEKDKLGRARTLCHSEGITLEETAYVGDDVNDLDLLSAVGLAACPCDAVPAIKDIPGILLLQSRGGEGAVRELAEFIMEQGNFQACPQGTKRL